MNKETNNLSYLERKILSLIEIKPRTRKEILKLINRNRTHIYDAILKLNTQMYIKKEVSKKQTIFSIF